MYRRSLTEKIEFVFATLAQLGLQVPAGSRFDRMRRLFLEKKGCPTRFVRPDEPCFRMALEALRDFCLLEPILESIGQVQGGGVGRLRNLLRDTVVPHDSSHSKGRDCQAELLVAATCVRAGMTPVSLEEPDVRCVVDGEGWLIAVKRVKNQKRIDDNLRDASQQASGGDEPGVIFLDVSQAFDPSDDQVTRPMATGEFRQLLRIGLRRGIQSHEESLHKRARGRGVGLVYFFFSILRHDPESGWELATIHMHVDTAVDEAQRRRCQTFRDMFSGGIDRLT